MITSPKFYRFAQILTVLIFPAAVAGLWFIEVEDTVNVSGLISSSQQEIVSSPCNGTMIETVLVENGDLVEPGQALVVLKDLEGRQSKVQRLDSQLKRLRDERATYTHSEPLIPRIVSLKSEGDILKGLEDMMERLSRPVQPAGSAPVPSTYHAEIQRLTQQESQLKKELEHIKKMVNQNLMPRKKQDDLAYNLEQVVTGRRYAELSLQEKRNATQEEWVNSRNRLAKIQAEIDAERSRLTHEITQTELTLEELNRDLGRLVITAPFRGRVVDVLAKAFQPVSIGTPLVEVSGLEPKIITCRVPENRILEVKPKQVVVIKSNLYNFLKHDVYHGEVKHIAPHGIHENTRVFYEVTIAIDEGHEILKVGSAAGCEILVGSNPAIFLLIGNH